jgi:transposase-like protein
VSKEGYRDVLGVCLGSREDEGSWTSFLRHLKDRGWKVSASSPRTRRRDWSV